MARIIFILSTTDPLGRPIPASVLYDVEYQNNESKKEEDGRLITQAIIALRSFREIADKVGNPTFFETYRADNIPDNWTSLSSRVDTFIIPAFFYVGGQVRFAGTIGDGGFASVNFAIGEFGDRGEQGAENDDVISEFNIEFNLAPLTLDDLNAAVAANDLAFQLQSFCIDSSGTITKLEVELAYEIIF